MGSGVVAWSPSPLAVDLPRRWRWTVKRRRLRPRWRVRPRPHPHHHHRHRRLVCLPPMSSSFCILADRDLTSPTISTFTPASGCVAKFVVWTEHRVVISFSAGGCEKGDIWRALFVFPRPETESNVQGKSLEFSPVLTGVWYGVGLLHTSNRCWLGNASPVLIY